MVVVLESWWPRAAASSGGRAVLFVVRRYCWVKVSMVGLVGEWDWGGCGVVVSQDARRDGVSESCSACTRVHVERGDCVSFVMH